MRQPVEIRIPPAVRVYTVCFGLLWVGILFAAIVTSPLFEASFDLLMVALGGALILRIESLRFVADESGLLVRNLYRTWRLSWDEVEDFRVSQAMMGMPFGKVIHVLLRNGEVVKVDVTMKPGVFSGGEVMLEQTLQRLCRWLPARD